MDPGPLHTRSGAPASGRRRSSSPGTSSTATAGRPHGAIAPGQSGSHGPDGPDRRHSHAAPSSPDSLEDALIDTDPRSTPDTDERLVQLLADAFRRDLERSPLGAEAEDEFRAVAAAAAAALDDPDDEPA